MLIVGEIGIRWILLEVDSLCVTQLVASSSIPTNGCSQLVLSIQDLLKRKWHVEIKTIYRQANFVVDALANYAHSLPLSLHIFRSPPASINHIIIHDMYGVAYLRFVLS